MKNLLSREELQRYGRHLILPDFGKKGQERLKRSSVLVVGAGGLGSPVLMYLAAAGVGHIGIVDFDVVDESNLQRQVLYTVDDVGKSKAQTAKTKLEKLNPHIKITVFETRLDKNNVFEIIKNFDVVADGTDNFPTRYLVNDACVIAGKVNVFASIYRFEGQVSVFNFLKKDGTRGANYRDLFPEPPADGLVPDCAEGGVLGVLPGIVGSMQASEVIKVLAGVGEPLADRIFIFDAASFSTHILKIRKNPKLKITTLTDYEEVCETDFSVKEITVADFKKMKESNEDFQLIDVREPLEYEVENMGGELLSLGQIFAKADKISKTKKVIIHCRTGVRSARAIRELQEKFGFENLWNLKGGIEAWKQL